MKNKLIVLILLAGVISLGVASLVARADTNSTSTATSSDSGRPAKLPANKLEIGPSGEINLVGSVTAVGSGSIAVKTWGGIWNANFATDTIVTGMGAKIDVSQIQVGDVVGVHGKMSADSGLNLQTKVIKDFSLLKSNVKKEIKEVRDEVRKEIKNEDREESNGRLNFWEALKQFLQTRKQNSQ